MKIKKLFRMAFSFGGMRTLVLSHLLITMFMVGGVQQTTAQSVSLQSTIDGIETLEGCSVDDIKNSKATAIGTFPTGDRSKIFFLYNVKTGLLLNAGAIGAPTCR